MNKWERPLPYAADSAAREIGQHLATWRKLQRLTAQLTSAAAEIERGEVRRVERRSRD